MNEYDKAREVALEIFDVLSREESLATSLTAMSVVLSYIIWATPRDNQEKVLQNFVDVTKLFIEAGKESFEAESLWASKQ